MSIRRHTVKIFGEEFVYYSWSQSPPDIQQSIPSTQGGQYGQPVIQQLVQPSSQVEPGLPYEPLTPLLNEDVMVMTPTTFEQALSQASSSQRARRTSHVIRLETAITVESLIGGQGGVRVAAETQQRREVSRQHLPVLDLTLGGTSMNAPVAPPPPRSPSPPPAPTNITCPICMERIVVMTSTKCGHVFCDRCIRTVVAQGPGRCPTCRARVTRRDLFRIYLPVNN